MDDGGKLGTDDTMTPREQIRQVQQAVLDRGGSVGNAGADGIWGDGTFDGVMDTLALIPETAKVNTKFDAASGGRLAQAHPDIQRIMNTARAEIEFRVLDSQRGRDAQERAFRSGNSKAHFGQSAHNWSPAIAVDLFPAPYDWNNRKAFERLYGVIGRYDANTGKGTGLALQMKIPLRCGLDWHMDGVNSGDDWDGGHYELHPWREWAKSAKPFNG